MGCVAAWVVAICEAADTILPMCDTTEPEARIERTRLAHELGEHVARVGSFARAARVLGIDCADLIALLVYRFQFTPRAELIRFGSALAAQG